MKKTIVLVAPTAAQSASIGTNVSSSKPVNKNNSTKQQSDHNDVGAEEKLLVAVDPNTKEIHCAFTSPEEMVTEGKLTAKEKALLKEHEDSIEKNLDAFKQVPIALHEIQRLKLYRAQYSSFDEYCQERWGFKRARGYQLACAGKAAVKLSSTLDSLQIENTAQLEAIATSDNPEIQVAAVQQAKKKAGSGAVTAKAIKEEIKRIEAPAEVVDENATEAQADSVKPAKKSKTVSFLLKQLRKAMGLLDREATIEEVRTLLNSVEAGLQGMLEAVKAV